MKFYDFDEAVAALRKRLPEEEIEKWNMSLQAQELCRIKGECCPSTLYWFKRWRKKQGVKGLTYRIGFVKNNISLEDQQRLKIPYQLLIHCWLEIDGVVVETSAEWQKNNGYVRRPEDVEDGNEAYFTKCEEHKEMMLNTWRLMTKPGRLYREDVFRLLKAVVEDKMLEKNFACPLKNCDTFENTTEDEWIEKWRSKWSIYPQITNEMLNVEEKAERIRYRNQQLKLDFELEF